MSKTDSITEKFDEAKQIITVRPFAIMQAGFIYRGFSDLKNLLAFVGSKPTIDENSQLWFGEFMIAENSVILRDAQGHVTKVLNFEAAAGALELVTSEEFKPEHANVIVPKVKAEGAKSSRGGASRADYVVALKAAAIEFDARASKAELIATFEAAGGVL